MPYAQEQGYSISFCLNHFFDVQFERCDGYCFAFQYAASTLTNLKRSLLIQDKNTEGLLRMPAKLRVKSNEHFFFVRVKPTRSRPIPLSSILTASPATS